MTRRRDNGITRIGLTRVGLRLLVAAPIGEAHEDEKITPSNHGASGFGPVVVPGIEGLECLLLCLGARKADGEGTVGVTGWLVAFCCLPVAVCPLLFAIGPWLLAFCFGRLLLARCPEAISHGQLASSD